MPTMVTYRVHLSYRRARSNGARTEQEIMIQIEAQDTEEREQQLVADKVDDEIMFQLGSEFSNPERARIGARIQHPDIEGDTPMAEHYGG